MGHGRAALGLATWKAFGTFFTFFCKKLGIFQSITRTFIILKGGSSNLNYMLYVRGHPLDYEYWANITGDPEWKYENVLPQFKKSLDYNGAFSENGTTTNTHFNMFYYILLLDII